MVQAAQEDVKLEPFCIWEFQLCSVIWIEQSKQQELFRENLSGAA